MTALLSSGEGADEKCERALDEEWRGLREFRKAATEYIAALEAEVKDLQECWDEAEEMALFLPIMRQIFAESEQPGRR